MAKRVVMDPNSRFAVYWSPVEAAYWLNIGGADYWRDLMVSGTVASVQLPGRKHRKLKRTACEAYLAELETKAVEPVEPTPVIDYAARKRDFHRAVSGV